MELAVRARRRDSQSDERDFDDRVRLQESAIANVLRPGDVGPAEAGAVNPAEDGEEKEAEELKRVPVL